MFTMELSLEFETGPMETEIKSSDLLVHRAIFLVNNLEGVEFTDIRNKIVLIGPAKLAPGVTYFMFRSIVNGFTVDNYAPDNSLFRTPYTLTKLSYVIVFTSCMMFLSY